MESAMASPVSLTQVQQPVIVRVSGEILGSEHRDPGVKQKVIVAIHGVGDQHNYATIQSVVHQFCRFYELPAGVPLGRFYSGDGPVSIGAPYPENLFAGFTFAEVYWAKIPRDMVDGKHVIEESKKWADTIVQRFLLRWMKFRKEGLWNDAEELGPELLWSRCKKFGRERIWNEDGFKTTKLVLQDLFQTLTVLEQLSFLGDRAGLFTFDLKKLLEDYLGDVQVVVEFETQRKAIIATFEDLMMKVHEINPGAETFLVAHSEGTVIALLALLKAGRGPIPPWFRQVRGFMTMGSPIDKHLCLWPELFEGDDPVNRGRGPDASLQGQPKIPWRNYYDHGDPIGFDLDDARAWMRFKGWDSVFDFTWQNDIGFSRYPLPGKAHLDYWTDSAVFDHFIGTVVKAPPRMSRRGEKRPDPPKPASKWLNRLLSYTVPYVGVAAILFIGVYILYKAVIDAIFPGRSTIDTVVSTVGAITILLLGITVATRIWRLTREWPWRGIGYLILVVLIPAALWVGQSSGEMPKFSVSIFGHLLSSTDYIVVAGVLVTFITVGSMVKPSWGLKLLIFSGTATIVTVVSLGIASIPEKQVGPLWPVFLATAVFLYMWWLAALMFDLVFVWHFHIRHGKALRHMDEMMGRLRGRTKGVHKGDGGAWPEGVHSKPGRSI
jgi:hypothetical protein